MARSQLERGLAIVELLFGHVLDGLDNKEICRRLEESPVNICRDLDILKAAGWLQQLGKGRWKLTEKPTALMKTYEVYKNNWHERMELYDARANARARQMIR